MNERIFELAKQADLIQWDTLPSGARTPDHESVVKAKKFAELIVRECIGVIEAKMPEFTCKEDYDNLIRKAGRMDAIDEIREHFGVK